MQSPDHPDLPYVEALKTSGAPMYTAGRPDGPPLWIVVHDMEYPERNDAAEWTANYFHTGAGGRSVSSHYCADRDSVVQCVLLGNSAWTVGNRKGNNRGINWEFAGYAAQTRAEWLDDFSLSMLRRAAPYIVSDAARFGIPLRTLTDAEVAKNLPGVTSHWQLGRVFGGTTHTDPGPNFPWDVFMNILLTEGNVGSMDEFCKYGDEGDNVAALHCDLLTYFGHAINVQSRYEDTVTAMLKEACADVGWVVDGRTYWAGERSAFHKAWAIKFGGGSDGGGDGLSEAEVRDIAEQEAREEIGHATATTSLAPGPEDND